MIKATELQTEFSQSHGNAEPWGYWQSHGPRWSDAYVEWLESLVIKMRARPDLLQIEDDS